MPKSLIPRCRNLQLAARLHRIKSEMRRSKGEKTKVSPPPPPPPQPEEKEIEKEVEAPLELDDLGIGVLIFTGIFLSSNLPSLLKTLRWKVVYNTFYVSPITRSIQSCSER